ncbi:hypothetical protein ACPPVW_06470 [Leifsonia sp. McL0607]|uniref:hypothetical protein n=1 Tax=Leifsonia sp. McL0607 TaxID=3415672 RepID=UPI003CF3C34C
MTYRRDLLDDFFANWVGQIDNETAAIRFPRGIRPDWQPGVIRYDMNGDLVLNNFFNGTITIRFEMTFTVTHEESTDPIDATIFHSSDVDFSWIEDVSSIGASAIIANTADKLVPVILTLIAREIERETIAELRRSLRLFSNKRLLGIRIYGDPAAVVFQLCPKPKQPQPGTIDPVDPSVLR